MLQFSQICAPSIDKLVNSVLSWICRESLHSTFTTEYTA